MSRSYPADVVDKWHKMWDEFNCDSSQPNPYDVTFADSEGIRT